MRSIPRTRRILIVDDDMECRQDVRELLESHGFVTEEAVDGHAALDSLVWERAPQPSLIILDMEMPRLTGWEFLAIIKSYYRLSAIPVIVLTGRTPAEALRHNTIDGFLLKPYDPEELLALVESVLNKDDTPGSKERTG